MIWEGSRRVIIRILERELRVENVKGVMMECNVKVLHRGSREGKEK